MKRAVAYVDGGNRGAPGPHACAAVLKVAGEEDQEFCQYLGPEGTNNRAEWGGLILALREATRVGVTHLCVRSDSRLIVEQSLGNWRVKEASLRPLYLDAQDLARGFEEVSIDHVPREQNRQADALCTALLDEITGRRRGG